MGEQEPVDDPVEIAELAALIPTLTQLPIERQGALVGALNLVRAPCEPCWDEGQSIARCLVVAPPRCDNLEELQARALRLTTAGAPQSAISAVLVYGDSWTPAGAGEGRGWPAPDSPVSVELWLDPTWGPWRDAVKTADQLDAATRADDALGAVSLTVRLFPTWAWREQAPPPGAELLHRAVAAADRLGLGLPYARALAQAAAATPKTDADAQQAVDAAAAATDGLDVAAWTSLRDGPDVAADLAQDQRDALDIGLRAAPSWRVDGYRLRGPRLLDSLIDVVENQWLDHHDRIPAPLLAPLTPAPGARTTP